jgi:hypothetical protein
LPGATAKLFRDAAGIKKVRKRKTILGSEDLAMDASVTDELVADHEWEALLQPFEQETDALSPGAGGLEEDGGDELWERLSSTRWLKAAAPVVLPKPSSSETSALDLQPGL